MEIPKIADRKLEAKTIKYMFKDIKEKVAKRFDRLVKSGRTIFNVEYSRDEIWEKYLGGFSEDLRQEHNCNCCKSFIRQVGGMVVINEDLTVRTIWGVDSPPEEYLGPMRALDGYVKSLSIKGLFYHGGSAAGTDRNHDAKRDVIWEHFYAKIPDALNDRQGIFATKSDKLRDRKNSLKRGIEEISSESIQTVLEMIAQGSLYRGNDYKRLIDSFKRTKKASEAVEPDLMDRFLWVKAAEMPEGASGIRSTAIGTLLLDLSEGKDLENSVRAFERMVAPANYKRPKALVTPRMIAAAKQKLEELGMLSALDRRILDSRDLNASNALFVHRRKRASSDVFGNLIDESEVNPSELKRVEEIGIKDFIERVIPSAESIRLLFESKHTGNLCTLTGPVDEDAKDLFNWDNSYGWSYSGGVADSIKEKVKRAGGSVAGWLRFSLEWYNTDDLDIHFRGPRSHIYYGDKTALHGSLDVDMNANSLMSKEPVENIIFKRRLPKGDYFIHVNNFRNRNSQDKGFSVQMEHNGEIKNFSSSQSPIHGEFSEKIEFSVSESGSIVVKDNGYSKSGTSITKWGLSTNTWQRVNAITLSPNHWTTPKGNKHWFFLLDGCVSDEDTRPFYNEFLCNELKENRKVMEVLGGKVKVAEAEGKELSGLGFSETIRNDFYAEVQGSFKRTLKVKI